MSAREVAIAGGLLALSFLLGSAFFSIAGAERHLQYITVPLPGVAGLIEHRLGISLEQLSNILLQLARAQREGRFDAAYTDLLPQGLEGLVSWLRDFARPWDPPEARLRVYVRDLALKWERFLAGRAAPQPQGTLHPQLIREALGAYAATKLLDYLLCAVVSFVAGKDRPDWVRSIVKPHVDGEHVLIQWRDQPAIKVIYWMLCREWVESMIEVFGSPQLPPAIAPLDGHWAAFLSHVGLRLILWPQKANSVAIIANLITVYNARWNAVRRQHGVDGGRQQFAPAFQYMLETMAYLSHAIAGRWEVLAATPADYACEVRVVLRQLRPEQTTGHDNRHVPLGFMDIFVVNYADRVPGTDKNRLLNWVWETERSHDQNAYLGRPTRPGTATWGLDLVAVVITSELDGEGAKTLLELARVIKDHADYLRQRRGGHDPRLDNKRGRAVAIVWRGTDGTIYYTWAESGRGDTSADVRREAVRAIAGGTIYDRIIEVDPARPLSFRGGLG